MAKRKAKKRRFVVGYSGCNERLVWGRDAFSLPGKSMLRENDYCMAMTEHQAALAVKTLPSKNAAVYELVLVK